MSVRRLWQWLLTRHGGHSLADRFGWAAAAATAALTVGLGALSFFFSATLLLGQIHERLVHDTELSAQRVELTLNEISGHLRALAATSLVTNALLDSQGRDIYLRPFFADQRDFAPQGALRLSDFSGKPLVSSAPQHADAPGLSPTERRRLVELNQASAMVRLAPGAHGPRPFLLLAFPVIYPGTRQAEGLLELSMPLDRVITQARHTGGNSRLSLLSGGETILGSPATSALLAAQQRLQLDAPLTSMGLELNLRTHRWRPFAPLATLLGTYLLAGGVAAWLLARLARRGARSLAEPLRQLADQAEAIARGGRLDVVLESRGGAEEVTRLAQSLRRMTRHLAAAREQLEQRVEERTQALRASEERWALALEGNNDGIWDWHPGSGQLFLSSRWKSMLGYGDTELADRYEEWLSRVHPDDVERVLHDAQRHLRGSTEYYENEHRLRCKDGGYKWILARGRAVRDAAGRPVRMVGSHTDVSERRRLEETLQQRERYQRALLDNFPFLVWLKDTESRFLAVNQPFAKACGLARVEAVVGKTDFDVWPQDLARQYRADDREVLASRTQKSVEEAVADHGARTWFETYKAPVVGSDGEVLGTVGFARDITDRKQAEALIQERTQQLDTLFALSPDGFVSFDANGLINLANPAFERMTGLSRDEVLGLDRRRLEDLLRARAVNPEHWQTLDACSAPDQRMLLELRRPRSLVLEIGCVRSHASGDGVSMVVYLRDVTHQVEVDRMKSEFLSVAAHELRTPMASIYGFTELLLESDFDEDTRRDLLQTIYQQVTLLVDIINELLDLARIEARRGKDFDITDVNLPALVGETLNAFAADRDRWPLRYRAPANAAEATVRGDAAKLRQALTNVLSNARKYSPDGGPIEISLVDNGADPADPVGVAVADHGIGMTAEHLDRIFERFYRADTSGKVPGSGLGMSIVKEILELHGGSVEVQSEPQVGTRVVLWLPRRQPNPNTPSTADSRLTKVAARPPA